MPLNLTWVDLASSCTKGYPGQAKRHSLPFQEEAQAVLKFLVVPLTFALDCTYHLCQPGVGAVLTSLPLTGPAETVAVAAAGGEGVMTGPARTPAEPATVGRYTKRDAAATDSFTV